LYKIDLQATNQMNYILKCIFFRRNFQRYTCPTLSFCLFLRHERKQSTLQFKSCAFRK